MGDGGGEEKRPEGGGAGEHSVKNPTVFYGVCIPESSLKENVEPPDTAVFTELSQALKVAKQFNGTFKLFKSEIEALEFSTSKQITQTSQMSTPVPGESSTYGSLKPQQMVKFRKAIEAGNLDFVLECVRENPRYLMTPSDTPAILQEGSRYNALHIVAKSGKFTIGETLLNIIKDEITDQMYPDADVAQNCVRASRLLDLYINMPDKGSGDTPLHLAAKFGNLEVVELLTGEKDLIRTRLNKYEESALDVVCSRAKVKDKGREDKIRELIQGMYYIPVYKEIDGVSVLGEPIPQSEYRLNKRSPEDLEGNDTLDSAVTGSPRTPRTSRGRAGSLNRTFTLSASPARRGSSPFSSVRSQGSSLNMTSPAIIPGSPSQLLQSPQVVHTPVFVSALIGPLSEKKAQSAFKELKSCDSRQRLQDPIKGMERQCQGVAKRIQAQFTEYWPFLDAHVDLHSEEGLQRLEHHLTNMQQVLVRLEEMERCKELEDEQADNSVFLQDNNAEMMEGGMGEEMEFFLQQDNNNFTPIRPRHQKLDSDQHLNQGISTPLSPVSLLSSALDGLDIGPLSATSAKTTFSNENDVCGMQKHDQGFRNRRPSFETKELVEKFGFMFSQSLVENLPDIDSDSNIQDWGLSLLTHWETLRRQVNMMRSDPQERWKGLDFTALAQRVIECIERELDDAVHEEEYSKIQSYLNRIASFRLDSTSQGKESTANSISEFRVQRQSSVRDVTKLKELQPLARTLASFMEQRVFQDNEKLDLIWNYHTTNISAEKVNKGRKFLHSKVFSDSDSSTKSEQNSSLSQSDFSWVNQSMARSSKSSTDKSSSLWLTSGLRRQRADSMSSLTSQGSSQYCTPPSSPTRSASPAPSQVSSMLTADEGVVVWLEGKEPTQTDRQVVAALEGLDQDMLLHYPNLMSYLIMAGNYSAAEMKRWPSKPKSATMSGHNVSRPDMERRKLNLDMSSLLID